MINETICNRFYRFNFSEEDISINMVPYPFKKRLFGDIFVAILILGSALFVSIYGILMGTYSYALVTLPIAISLIPVAILSEYREMKKEKKYKFVINNIGVCQREIDKEYLLRWDEIFAWGIANNNYRFSARTRPPKQMCIYFSKCASYTEKELRKAFKFMEDKKYMHANTDEIIVFGFRENTVDEALYNRIVQFISERCNIEPTNYIEQVTDF